MNGRIEVKGFFPLLFDFSFRRRVTTRIPFIYWLHLLAGVTGGGVLVNYAFHNSHSQGVLVLVLSLVGFIFWLLYVRIALETLAAIFRMADAAAPQAERN